MPTMNERERYLAVLTFQRPDRIPMRTMGPRESTIRRWRSEGLPAGVDWFDTLCNELGIVYDHPTAPRVSPGVNFRMVPTFEEKVLEHTDGHYIVQDWMGNVTEISDEYDYTYIRSARDFVTRKWHKFPVENRDDWEKMKARYDVDAPGRFMEGFEQQVEEYQQRDFPVGIHFNGPFWQLREWCGFEPLCMMFIDQPDLVRDMCTFWGEYVAEILQRVLPRVQVDHVHTSEDMAYKEKPMIGPGMTDEFLMPCYDLWMELARQNDVPLFGIDSDGRVDELIPVWIDHGINFTDPMEVAAGNDIVAYRKRFGTKMAFKGGVDKRAMATGGTVLRGEIDRVCSIIDGGGYIPGCDHGVPHDVSLENYLETVRLLAEKTGWL